MNTLKYIIILVVFSSCGKDYTRQIINSKQIDIESFPVSHTLKGEKVDIKLHGIEKISIVDTFLIGYDFDTKKKFMKVFSSNTYNYLGDLIYRGKGPNELLFVTSDDQYYTDSLGCHLWIGDYARFCKIYLLNITQSIISGSAVFDTTFVLRNNQATTQYQINDSIAVGFIYTHDNSRDIVRYNKKSRTIIEQKNIFDDKFINKSHDDFYHFNTCINEGLDQTAGCSIYQNIIYIFNTDFTENVTINVEDQQKVTWNEMNKESIDRIQKYRNMVTNNGLIYALHVNKTYDEIFDENCNEGAEIHVFTWNGEPVYKLKIKENIWQITFDHVNQSIYGYSPLEKVYKYNLSELLF